MPVTFNFDTAIGDKDGVKSKIQVS
ncbi:hypothetical protein, partial [Streptomyces sp. NPDC005568]